MKISAARTEPQKSGDASPAPNGRVILTAPEWTILAHAPHQGLIPTIGEKGLRSGAQAGRARSGTGCTAKTRSGKGSRGGRPYFEDLHARGLRAGCADLGLFCRGLWRARRGAISRLYGPGVLSLRRLSDRVPRVHAELRPAVVRDPAREGRRMRRVRPVRHPAQQRPDSPASRAVHLQNRVRRQDRPSPRLLGLPVRPCIVRIAPGGRVRHVPHGEPGSETIRNQRHRNVPAGADRRTRPRPAGPADGSPQTDSQADRQPGSPQPTAWQSGKPADGGRPTDRPKRRSISIHPAITSRK